MWKSFLLYICHSLKATSDGGGEEKFLDEDAFEGMITESLGMHTHGDVLVGKFRESFAESLGKCVTIEWKL